MLYEQQVYTTAAKCYSAAGFFNSVATYLSNAPACIARVGLDFRVRALLSGLSDFLSKNIICGIYILYMFPVFCRM